MTRAIRTEQQRAARDFLADTQLDRRGLPLSLEELEHAARDNSDPLAPDPRFAGLTEDAAVGAKNLKRFLSTLDADAVRESGDAQLAEQYEREHTESVVHIAGREARVRKVGAQWIATLNMNGTTQTFKAPSRDALLDKLAGFSRALACEHKRTRALTAEERLEIARQAQSGDPQSAIANYLWCAFDRANDVDGVAVLHDPQHRELCDEAVSFVWRTWRNDFSASPSRVAFMRDFVGDRPVTLALLDSAWKACQDVERRATDPKEPEPMPGPELDDLSDEQIVAFHHAAMRAHARAT